MDDKGRSKSMLDPTQIPVQRNNSIQKAINEMGGASIKGLSRTGSGLYLKQSGGYIGENVCSFL